MHRESVNLKFGEKVSTKKFSTKKLAIIENIHQNIFALPPTGASLIVMPMKIQGGSGAPARVVAAIPKSAI